MHQNKYAQYISKRFKMIKCNATITLLEIGAKLRKDIIDELVNSTLDKQIIGTFRYLCNTITNISQSVGMISKFMVKPRECHLIASKRVLRYIKGTLDHVILMHRHENINMNEIVHG